MEKKLLQHLKDLKTLACSDSGAMWVGGWNKDDEKHHQQIVAILKKPKVKRLLTLLSHWANECERNEFWNKEDEQAYQQIVDLIKKPENHEQNLADCTEAIDILIRQHEELCDEREILIKKPEVTEEWIEKKVEEKKEEGK